MKQYISIALAVFTALLFGGCAGAPWRSVEEIATLQSNGRVGYNIARLEAEKEMAAKPVISFRLSPALARALAQAEIEGDEPLVSFDYNPRFAFSGYTESPWYRLIPTGGEAIAGFLGGFALWSNHENTQARLDVDRELSLREYDSRDAIIGALTAPAPSAEAGAAPSAASPSEAPSEALSPTPEPAL